MHVRRCANIDHNISKSYLLCTTSIFDNILVILKNNFSRNNMIQEQAIKEKQVSGRIQVQIWYHDDRNELVVNLLAADDLALRDEGE